MKKKTQPRCICYIALKKLQEQGYIISFTVMHKIKKSKKSTK